MSGTFGIEKPRWSESRFQRWFFGAIKIPGALPQAQHETAPLALNRFVLSEFPVAKRTLNVRKEPPLAYR